MKNSIVLTCAFGLIISSCSLIEKEENFGPRPLTASEKALVEKGNTFSFQFLKENAQAGDKNWFVSPLSAYFALAMVKNGASAETEAEFQAVLGGAGSQENINETSKSLANYLTHLDPKVTFLSKNAVFYRNTFVFKQTFFKTVQEFFDAEVAGLDYDDPKSVAVINDWVKSSTNGLIPNIIDEISADAVMHLINAIYFKADWKTKFDEDETQDRTFFAESGAKEVPTMRTEASFEVLKNANLQLARLPYGNGEMEMVLLLPEAGLDAAFFESFDEAKLDDWLSQTRSQEAMIQLPKFTISFEKSLVETLQKMGLVRVFNPVQAQLTNLSDARNLFISEVKQKTFVQVDEKGTEAAAVTAVTVEITSIENPPMIPQLIFDRPFLYLIRDRSSGAILFAGKMDEFN